MSIDRALRRSPLSTDGCAPAPIDLIAENYRFKLFARLAGLAAQIPHPEPRPLIPILVLEPSHPPQTARAVHFVPYAHDVVPANAHCFDYARAMSERAALLDERRHALLLEALRRCDARPARPRTPPPLSPQRLPLRSGERQKFTSGITLPSKNPTPPRRRSAPAAQPPGLEEALTIARVALPERGRARAAPAKAGGAGKGRYRSPPPRTPRIAAAEMQVRQIAGD